MKLIKTKYGKTLVMNFVDAEHSGMNFGDLKFESEISNIDIEKENPIALIIQFDGGFINPNKEQRKATINFIKFIMSLK